MLCVHSTAFSLLSTFPFSFKSTPLTHLVHFKHIWLDIVGYRSSAKISIKKKNPQKSSYILCSTIFPLPVHNAMGKKKKGKESLQIEEKKLKIN